MLDRTFAMNLKKINLELARQALLSDNTASDKITLWHVAKSNLDKDKLTRFFVRRDKFDPNKVFDNLKSFFNNGVLSVGNGVGGQSGGFFVHNKKAFAVSYFYNDLSQNQIHNKKNGKIEDVVDYANEALLIGTTINKNELKYPAWQFDLEIADYKILNQILYKYKDLAYTIKTLKTPKQEVSIIPLLRPMSEGEFKLKIKYNNYTETLQIDEFDRTDNLDIWQALFDKLCEDKEFRQDYNELLQKSTTSNTRTAIKYCGKSPLNVDEISYLKKDTDGNMTETSLYTSSTCKEKQVCPFLQLKFAKEKN